ncbi:MAG: tyrosine-type recombinase/integrase, partial [Planctomycetota bacterium]
MRANLQKRWIQVDRRGRRCRERCHRCQLARWIGPDGKKRTAEVTAAKDGTPRIRTKAKTYTAKYRDGEGIVREVATGCTDKEAATAVLNDLVGRAQLVRAKVMTPDQDRIADHQLTPLRDHVLAYTDHLRSRGVSADRIKTTRARMFQTIEGCCWRLLSDMKVDHLERYLQTLVEPSVDAEVLPQPVSASVYNGFVEAWVAFGFWCIGKRMAGKRSHMNGEKRLLANPFRGMRRLDAKQDRRRVARALTEDELVRLIDVARRRPLEAAQTVRTGPRKGQQGAKVSADRAAALTRLGWERALIYKTLVLTGLRADELRTLTITDLSFGDVPFIKLRHSNEKNRAGSTIALRADLAKALRDWICDRDRSETVFNVPKGFLRIMNRDLAAAEISKTDADGCVVHIHALRHSFGTHLSKAGVAPRVAQAAMRHSDIALTMNTYTDARLLDTAAAVETLPKLDMTPDVETPPRMVAPGVAPDVAPNAVQPGRSGQQLATSGDVQTEAPDEEKARDLLRFMSLIAIGATRLELATSTSRTKWPSDEYAAKH